MHRASSAVLLISGILAFAAGPPARAASDGITVVSEGPVQQLHATSILVHSRALGRDFLLDITPPALPLAPGRKVAAVYALDGGYGVAGPIGALLGASDAMSPAVIVSVGYQPAHYGDRDADLMHRAVRYDGRDFPGGGRAFARFLLDEVRPFVEARYPVDPSKAVLFGHSEGGLFAANVFADEPNAFSAYLIASPSVWLDPGVVDRVAAAARRAVHVKVFLAIGARETPTMVAGEARLVAVLSRAPAAVALKTQAYPRDRHISYYPAVITDGFPWLLPPASPIRIHPALLARYVGRYALADGRAVVVARRGDQLFITLDGYGEREFVPRSASRFVSYAETAEAAFDAAGDGRSLTLRIAGRDLRAARSR